MNCDDLSRESNSVARSSKIYTLSITTLCTLTSLFGRSFRPRGTFTIFSTTSWPSTTSPKMVCLPVSHGVGATVMKNCEPLVFGPAFAIASLPGLSNLCGEPLVSSSNLIAGAAHAGTFRVPALDHEIGNDAMKNRAIIQTV